MGDEKDEVTIGTSIGCPNKIIQGQKKKVTND